MSESADRLSLLLSSGNWATIQSVCLGTQDPKVIQAFKETEREISTIYEELASRIESLEEKIPSLEEKVNHLHSAIYTMGVEMKAEKKKKMKAECKLLEKVLIVNGIPHHQTAIKEERTETNEETKTQVLFMMKTLDLEHKVSIESVWRIPTKIVKNSEGKEFTTNATRITLTGTQDKFTIFKSLVQNGDRISGIKIHEAIPRDMIPLKKKLEKISAKWRKANPKLKTRVTCKNGELMIMQKNNEKGEEKFSKASTEDTDRELSWLKDEIIKAKKTDENTEVEIMSPDPQKKPTKSNQMKRKPTDPLHSSATKQKT